MNKKETKKTSKTKAVTQSKVEASTKIQAIGIDLGTSQSALSCVYEDGRIEVIPIIQFLSPGKIKEHDTLPSFLYVPLEGELDNTELPWQTEDKQKTNNNDYNGDDVYHAKKDSDKTDHHPDWEKGLVHVDLQGLVLPTLQGHHNDQFYQSL